MIERRIFATEFRDVAGSNGRQKWATAVTYNRVDDYGTIWLPSVFNDGLDERMPTILYGHDWYTLDHVLGQGIDYRDVPEGCEVLFEFADPELVPPAARAMALTSGPSPILKDVSVGFDRQEWRKKDELTAEQLAQGAEEAMVRALMDELSIVVRGAVPGAQLRGKRIWVVDGTVTDQEPVLEPPAPAAGRMVPENDVVELARRVNAGEVSYDDARTAVALLTGEERQPEGADPDEDTSMLALAVDAALDAAIDCADGVNITSWPAEAQQMFGCVVAAETAIDELLAALGVDDPDDLEIEIPVAGAATPGGQMAGEELEVRNDPLPDVELERIARRAMERSR